MKNILGLLLLSLVNLRAPAAIELPEIKLVDAVIMAHSIDLNLPVPTIVPCRGNQVYNYAWVLAHPYYGKHMFICAQTLMNFTTQEVSLILLHEGWHYKYSSYSTGLQEEYDADNYSTDMARVYGFSPSVCNVWVKVAGSMSNLIMAGDKDMSHPALRTRYLLCLQKLT